MKAKTNIDNTWIFKQIMQQRENINNIQVIWDQMCNNKNFHIKIIYTNLKRQDPEVPWSRLMQDNTRRPREIMTLWLACHGKLATKKWLMKFGMLTNNNCAFWSKEENIDHLLFECDSMKRIQSKVLKWIQKSHKPKSWSEELESLIQNSKGKGWKVDILKLATTETMYGLKKFRNDICFENYYDRDKIEDQIIDNIAHRRWYNRKIRRHIARMMLDQEFLLLLLSTRWLDPCDDYVLLGFLLIKVLIYSKKK